jgi:hypothetical protein
MIEWEAHESPGYLHPHGAKAAPIEIPGPNAISAPRPSLGRPKTMHGSTGSISITPGVGVTTRHPLNRIHHIGPLA